ncbi:SsgA family sporulation/cell division regulator [Amycolatopsis pigmentata]|uniref:SsgA family sporulation/cell division regulator n=1 Tax=Amycolatopsis pigmentata TaxID=450801 RepID=A0ABW5G5K7_9PSEU
MDRVEHGLYAARQHGRSWGSQPVTLVYDPSDPYAVMWQFPDGNEWACSRELLAQGLVETTRTGGDVAFVPLDAAIDVTLRSPNGAIVLRFHAPDLGRFLDATKDLVPLGSERIDWDRAMRALGGAR